MTQVIKQQNHKDIYQKHINSGIQALQARRDKFLSNRLQFLNQFCQPLQRNIDELKDQIKYYQNMRDTQNQVIQNQTDVLSLKKQIKQYSETQNYFQNKLDDYQKSIFQLQKDIQQYERLIEGRRMKVAGLAASITSKSKASSRIKHNISTNINTSILNSDSRVNKYKSIYSSDLYHQQSEQNQQEQQNSIFLPKILKPTNRRPPPKYYIFAKQNKYKTLLQNSNNPSISLIDNNNPQQLTQQKTQQKIQQKKLTNKDIPSLIKQFDKTQALFRQCFQRKKLIIQKSVTQLQSRLITNKQTFLKVCQAIGNNNNSKINSNNTHDNMNSVNYQQFMQLTPDQLMTIFISFGWLNRRIYAEFNNKRRNILEQMKKYKKY